MQKTLHQGLPSRHCKA